jgi:low temperature requirement protein LtrA
MLADFRRRFWLPPRAHGQVIENRTVSFLELFYDLVYVVVIGRAAHHLAGHVTWRGVGEFAVLFGLTWIAWLNGTLYYELHGREEGRTRFYVFVQMLLLALLAVFIDGAGGSDGVPFGVAYMLFLAVLSWLWYTVRLQDEEQYMASTARYLAGMVISIVAVGASLFLPEGPRLVLWAGVVGMWLVGSFLLARMSGVQSGLRVTDSMVERYGLFVIIVLGEVVVGVVGGLADSARDVESIATGLLGLMIGFAYWWTYFDFVGRRLPRDEPLTRNWWLAAHLPVTMSIAGAGAAMVNLIEEAGDGATPGATSWLLCGSVAVALAGMVLQAQTLLDYEKLPELLRPVSVAMLVTALLALLLGLLAPVPWVLAALLFTALSALWVYAVARWMRVGASDKTAPG